MTDITRRELLSGATAAAATAALGPLLGTAPCALADTPEPPEKTFGRFSGLLTGIDANVLAPPVDPLGLNHEIFAKANEQNAATLEAMLQKFSAAGNDTEKQKAVVAAMMMKPAAGDDLGEKMRFLGRSIILAWYLGAWYAPENLKSHFYDQATTSKNPTYYSYRRYSKNVLIPHSVLSPSAYTGSAVWRAMQAHPMGYSNLQFGYWAQDPPELVAFITPGEVAK